MVAFVKDTRNCLGKDLAMAAITIELTVIIRNFEFKVLKTTYERDIQALCDLVAPGVHPRSLSMRV